MKNDHVTAINLNSETTVNPDSKVHEINKCCIEKVVLLMI